jgi:hypothetical protein
MKRYLCLQGLCALCIFAAPLRAQDTPFVDFDKDRTVAALFNGGLRPWRVWGLERDMLEIRPGVDASFKVGGITLPTINAVWEFNFNGKMITSVKGLTQTPWSSGEAYAALAPFEKALSGDPEAMRRFLHGYPQTSVDGEMWARRHRAGKLSVSYYLRHSFNDARPFLATIYFAWDYPPVEIVHNKEPIQPPPGFEDFDMRPAEARTRDVVEKDSPGIQSGSPLNANSVRREHQKRNTGSDNLLDWWWVLPALLALLVAVKLVVRRCVK